MLILDKKMNRGRNIVGSPLTAYSTHSTSYSTPAAATAYLSPYSSRISTSSSSSSKGTFNLYHGRSLSVDPGLAREAAITRQLIQSPKEEDGAIRSSR